jgi:hypothetical protein
MQAALSQRLERERERRKLAEDAAMQAQSATADIELPHDAEDFDLMEEGETNAAMRRRGCVLLSVP